MENYQKVVIDLLKASINKKSIAFNKKNNVQWNEVINEAKHHKISSLIYSSIDKSSFKYIDNNILVKWKEEILIDNVIQIKHINSISNLVNNLNEQRIEIMLLKGLVLRDFYPRPEYRTMGDADILVKPEDYLAVKNYMVENGYVCNEDNHPVHKRFICPNRPHIEVHWKLINNDYFSGYINNFEEEIWKKSNEVTICNVKSKTLCDEDFIIHLCLHMAVHIKSGGFGLRQLYDIAIFIKNKNIDWESFYTRISLYGISKFAKGLFKLLNQIFDIDIPKYILEDKSITKQEIQLLLDNVLASGVYGRKEEINGFNALREYGTNEQHIDSNVKRIFKFIFPTRAELSDRYSYAKNNILLLLPVAWIHHAITGIFTKKYGVVKILEYSKKSLNIVNRRKEIIKIFEL